MLTITENSGTTSLQFDASAGGLLPKPLRGTLRLFDALGFGVLTEFPLKSGRRADVLALSQAGEFWIAEVKSGVADFRTDHKWHEYAEWCDRFAFAVGPDFPTEILPESAGLIIADEYEGLIWREPVAARLPANRRKALTLRFAHTASRRLFSQTKL